MLYYLNIILHIHFHRIISDFLYKSRTIWNVKSNATLTFSIESNDSNAERMSYIIHGIDDTSPVKFSSLGEVTLKLIENGSNTIYSMNTEFKVGGNYQIVIQYREDNIFMVSVFIKFCISQTKYFLKCTFIAFDHFIFHRNQYSFMKLLPQIWSAPFGNYHKSW